MILWSLDQYYYYAACILLISVVSIATTLVETRTVSALSRECLQDAESPDNEAITRGFPFRMRCQGVAERLLYETLYLPLLSFSDTEQGAKSPATNLYQVMSTRFRTHHYHNFLATVFCLQEIV